MEVKRPRYTTWLCLTLLAVMVLSTFLTGCGGDGADTQPTGDTSEGGTTETQGSPSTLSVLSAALR